MSTPDLPIPADYGRIRQWFVHKHLGYGYTEYDLLQLHTKWKSIGKKAKQGRY